MGVSNSCHMDNGSLKEIWESVVKTGGGMFELLQTLGFINGPKEIVNNPTV